MIYEPTTFFTDILLAIIAFYCGVQTSGEYWRSFQLFHANFRFTLYAISISGLLGAIYHGFGPHFPIYLKNFVWKGTVLFIGVSTLFFLLATLVAVFPFQTYLVFRWIPVLATLVYWILIWRQPDFSNVVKFNIPALGFIFFIMIYLYFYSSQVGEGKIIVGLLIMFIGLLVLKYQVSLFRNFNHNDLYHVIQIIGLWYIYKGGLLLRDFSS